MTAEPQAGFFFSQVTCPRHRLLTPPFVARVAVGTILEEKAHEGAGPRIARVASTLPVIHGALRIARGACILGGEKGHV